MIKYEFAHANLLPIIKTVYWNWITENLKLAILLKILANHKVSPMIYDWDGVMTYEITKDGRDAIPF